MSILSADGRTRCGERGRSEKSQETYGLVAGIAAFTTWGLIPIYWKLLAAVSATEILAHRFVWTTIFLSVVLSWQRRWPELIANVRSRRARIYCLTGGLAIASNWFLFIYAVNIGRFIWIAVLLCVTFGLYGLLRKQSGTAAIPGLFIETILLVPFALVFLIYLQRSGTLMFARAGWSLSMLLISTGIVTAVPLFWFGYATRHLRLITVGFLQYLSPIGSFFLGVFLYHEPFTRGHLVTFVLIWLALALFTSEAVLRWRSSRVREIASCALEASALD